MPKVNAFRNKILIFCAKCLVMYDIDSIHLKNLFEYATCRNLDTGSDLNGKIEEEIKLLSIEKFKRYFDSFCEKSNDEYFGLHYGFYLSFQAMKVIFDISLTVSSIKQLTLIWKKYASISFPAVNVITVEKTNEYNLIFEGKLQTNLSTQALDTIIAFSYKELKIITGTTLLSITIPNKNLEEYKLWFDCPVVCGDTYSIKFNCSPDLITTNKKIRKRIENLLPGFLYYLENLKKNETSFSHKVKLMTLNLCEPDCPSMKKVASQFCMSTRTLQRKLQKENTSFRAISNDLKKELYIYLEKANHLRIIDKSFILGYSSSSAFLHARKSWNIS